jgi:hypothetical protein
MLALEDRRASAPPRLGTQPPAITRKAAPRVRSVIQGFRVFLVALMLYSSSPSHANPPSGDTAFSTNLASQRGQDLRKEIYAVYANMKARSVQRRSIDLTTLVEKYIPLGSSFKDAESVLRSAGCTVTPRSFANHTPHLQRTDSSYGTITLSTALFQATMFTVMLTPKAPGGSTVATIQAAIGTLYP